MRTFFLDAGHTQGKDPGACANGTTEHAEVAALVTRLAPLLAERGFTVHVLPFTLTLSQKIGYVNRRAVAEDLLLSLHLNSAGPKASGSEIYYYGGEDRSLAYARLLEKELGKERDLPVRGVYADTSTRFKRLGIIRDTLPWAFLLEVAFITNAGDLAWVREKSAPILAAALLPWIKEIFR